MKTLLTIVFFQLLFSLSSFAQEQPDSAMDKKVNFLLTKFENKTITETEKKEIKNLTYKIQNKGFILEEKFHDYQGSLKEINAALNIWIALGDTINEANNRKYKGYLLGHLSDFSVAKGEIFSAINLFKLKNVEWGVAVSQFDLAKVYDFQHNLDSSFIYANYALSYWKTKRDTSRIITINNLLIRLYCEAKNFTLAESLQKESLQLISFRNLHYQPVFDFYFLSYQLNEQQHKRELSIYYKNKLKEISEKNGIVKSEYDAN
ncbi:MAG: hypothetical protein JWQ63_484 [Mucilaginibacter sp.]|nr:hypothetical protein [Mucilaginibacter sp.]